MATALATTGSSRDSKEAGSQPIRMISFLARVVPRHPVLVLSIWAAIFFFAVPFAGLAPKALVASTGNIKDSQARKVADIIEQEFGQKLPDLTVLVTESRLASSDPSFLEAYNSLVQKLKALAGVTSLVRFDAKYPLALKSGDGKVTATVLEVSLENTGKTIEEIRRAAKEAKIPETTVYVTGAGAISRDFLALAESDIRRSELLALPLIGMVLYLAFGALVAAAVPLLVGIVSITASMAMLYGLTRLMDVSHFAQSVITMLSLGAGIDYALMLVNRFREELSHGRPSREAAEIATRTAGRAVAFSGLTVAIAMSALLVPDLTFVRSMGLGGVMAIVMTVLASITLVPAVLSLLGPRVNSPRRLRFKLTSSAKVHPFWGQWATTVMRRPLVFVLIVTPLMVTLALPALHMKLGYTGAFGLSSNVESRKGLELIRGLELGGSIDTFEVLLDLGSRGFTPDARTKWRELDRKLAAWPDVKLVISPFLTARTSLPDAEGGLSGLVSLNERSISKDRRYLRLSVIPQDVIHSSDIPGWAERLRKEAGDAGFETVLLGGAPIGSREFTSALVSAMPQAIGAVFIATFLLLAFAFRSLLIPLKSIVMNSLSVGAAYGVITQVIQNGVLAGFFGVPTDVGGLDSSIPLVMFAVIFGLSMDYEIFLLSRVQEAHLRGLETSQAVRTAIERTAGIITSAAIIMIIVFSAFIFGQVVANKTIGLGLSVAILLDATLVRLVLVPSVMMLAGKWNWWLPKPLQRWMPRISPEQDLNESSR